MILEQIDNGRRIEQEKQEAQVLIDNMYRQLSTGLKKEPLTGNRFGFKRQKTSTLPGETGPIETTFTGTYGVLLSGEPLETHAFSEIKITFQDTERSFRFQRSHSKPKGHYNLWYHHSLGDLGIKVDSLVDAKDFKDSIINPVFNPPLPENTPSST